MTANVETMFYVRETPWHGMGTRLEECPDSSEAIRAAGLDWEVKQYPLFFQTPDGTMVEAGNKVANVRETDNALLGIASEYYKIVQNHEAFSFTDSLLGEGVRYETAGSLNGGKRIWLLAKLPNHYKALGDEIEPYLAFTNSFDLCSGIRVCLTPIRVVCQNTLNLALSGARRTWTAYHSGNITNKLDEARKTLDIAHHYYETLVQEAEKLVEIKVDYEQLTEKLFPITEKTGAVAEANILSRREELGKLLLMKDLKKFKGTGWGFINGVADMVSHAAPARKTNTWKDSRLTKAFDGFELLDTATALVRKAA